MGIPRLSGIGPAPAVTEATKRAERAERKPARDTRELGLFRYAPWGAGNDPPSTDQLRGDTRP